MNLLIARSNLLVGLGILGTVLVVGLAVVFGMHGDDGEKSSGGEESAIESIFRAHLEAKFEEYQRHTYHFLSEESDRPVIAVKQDGISFGGEPVKALPEWAYVVEKLDLESTGKWYEFVRSGSHREVPIDGLVDELTVYLQAYTEVSEVPETVMLKTDGFAETYWFERTLATLAEVGVRYVLLDFPEWFDKALRESAGRESGKFFLTLWADGHGVGGAEPIEFAVPGRAVAAEEAFSTAEWLEHAGLRGKIEDIRTGEIGMRECSTHAAVVLESVWKSEWIEGVYPMLEQWREEHPLDLFEEAHYRYFAAMDLPVWVSFGLVARFHVSVRGPVWTVGKYGPLVGEFFLMEGTGEQGERLEVNLMRMVSFDEYVEHHLWR